MLDLSAENCLVLACKSAVSMEHVSPARGRDLSRPIAKIDNPRILISAGRVLAITEAKNPGIPSGWKRLDLGDVCLFPPLVNAHTHLQLSWLRQKTIWGRGFTPWLASMVPLLLKMRTFNGNEDLETASRSLFASGALFIGDVGGSIPGALAAVKSAAKRNSLQIRHFCEWFGWKKSGSSPWPLRCAEEAEFSDSPSGHALYSTSPQILRDAFSWCKENHRIFSFHLAESEDETELLASGSGPLYNYYRDLVLPHGWQAPKMRPLAYAQKLGLLQKNTLAVHGVRLNGGEIASLAQSGAWLCLCPRSNINLGAGVPPFNELLRAGAWLCLGTDGLTSCQDLDVLQDAIFLQKKFNAPIFALWRMLTVNGARALGFPHEVATIRPGARALFSLLPHELQ